MLNINNLINEYKQGNKEVFDNIFMQEERQIKDIIKTFHHMEYEDLYQVACIGLLKAIKSYDTSKNIKFNSYMYNVVKNEILMTLRNNNTMKNSNMEEVSTEAQTTDDLTVMDTLKSDVNIEDEYLIKEEYRELYELIDKYYSKNEMKRNVMYALLREEKQIDVAEKYGISRAYVNKIYQEFVKYGRMKMTA